jgi:lysophospholipase L1-like esterase
MAVSLHKDRAVLERAGLVPRDALHTVVAGETLFHIAKTYGTTVAALMRWNHLSASTIWPDDTLVVGRRKVPALEAVVPPGFEDIASFPGGVSQALSETVRLPRAVSDVFIRGLADGVSENAAVLDGFVLEHGGAGGVLYHTAGVNGAKARDFARSRRFLEQSTCLKPDLVILSFGTNEANSATYDLDDLRRSVAALASHFAAGGAVILVTTPPDGLDWQGRRNPRAALAAEALREEAQAEGLALWDWNRVMGGQGAAETWRSQGYMQQDGVHLSPAGYKLQERLFWQSLMDAYGRR